MYITALYDADRNEVDLSDYGAKKTVARILNDGVLTAITEHPPQALTDVYIKTDFAAYNLGLQMVVDGAANAAKLLKIFRHCQIVFDVNQGWVWDCVLKSVDRTMLNDIAVLNITFSAEAYGKQVTETISSTTQQITVTGAKDTYLDIICTSSGSVTFNGITIKSNGEQVEIISSKGVADMKKVDMTEFPHGVGIYPIYISGDIDGMTLQIKYRPRW